MGDSIQKAKARHEAELMATPGVVSVGIGMAENGKPAIIVGVQSDEPSIQQAIPQAVDGYPIVIQKMGTIRAQ